MATEAPFLAHTQCTAGVNLSNTAGLAGPNGAGQFLAVVMTASRVVGVAGAAASVIAGILQNDPLSGQAANIAFIGVTKAVAGGTIAAGNYLTTDSSGRLVVSTPGTNWALAQAIESAVINQVFTVLLVPQGSKN